MPLAQDLDAWLTRWINGWAGGGGALDHVMVWTTLGGVQVMVMLVAVQWWLGGGHRHTRHVLVAAGLSFLLGLAINHGIIEFVQRVRPYDAGVTNLLIAPSADPSFPSDHATAAVAIAAAFLLHRMPLRGALFGLAAGLVMVSRVYVGTHYLGDVLGGAVTGIVAAYAVRLVYREGTALDRMVTGIL